ncbi:MAG: AMP-binding protein [Acidimicrobiales bacterium]
MVDARASSDPDVVLAVGEAGDALTAAQLRAEAERTAAGLLELGVGPGTTVSWQLPTSRDAIVVTAALSRIGVTQNPLVPILREREVGFICRQLDTDLLIVPGIWRGFDFAAMAASLGIPYLVVDGTGPAGSADSLPPAPDRPGRWCFYTSGTTAEPKGARHTDETLRAAAGGMMARLRMGAGDVLTAVAPITHVGGIICLMASLETGMRQLLVEAFIPDRVIPFFREQGATLIGLGTPCFLAYLDHQDRHPEQAPLFPHVRAFLAGGAPTPANIHHRLTADLGAGVLSGYGLTEAPMLTWNDVDDDDDALANTEGRPVPGVELRIAPDGEILARGPQLTPGYVDPTLDRLEDGWFATGDLGTVDDRGYLRITGRAKDIIIRNMENISAKELEDLLYTHPEVADVAVIGVPDERTGERACAVVVPRHPGEPPTLAELVAHLRAAGLSDRKLPEELRLRDELPRNAMGKVMKHALR